MAFTDTTYQQVWGLPDEELFTLAYLSRPPTFEAPSPAGLWREIADRKLIYNFTVYMGHDVEDDPPHALSSASRWTCKKCYSAVLVYQGNWYGGALRQTCEEIREATKVYENEAWWMR